MVLRIPLRGTRLRRAIDPGDLGQPSGPDGEGQATGQARISRGEPPELLITQGDRKIRKFRSSYTMSAMSSEAA
jgi:hypothetical protein